MMQVIFFNMSIENETKAIVLASGVLKSLQSTCDASNVVVQLQETLELNQEALANPEPETTRLIRSFAIIAKGENRLDVVEHLRQITPAGTTGFFCLFVCLLVRSFVRSCTVMCFILKRAKYENG